MFTLPIIVAFLIGIVTTFLVGFLFILISIYFDQREQTKREKARIAERERLDRERHLRREIEKEAPDVPTGLNAETPFARAVRSGHPNPHQFDKVDHTGHRPSCPNHPANRGVGFVGGKNVRPNMPVIDSRIAGFQMIEIPKEVVESLFNTKLNDDAKPTRKTAAKKKAATNKKTRKAPKKGSRKTSKS